MAQARGTTGGVLIHAPRHLHLGPAARRCPLLASLDTIAKRERQSPTYAVAVIGLLRHSPSRCLREIGPLAVILSARQHLGWPGPAKKT